MDKKSKVLIILFIITILISVFFTYKRSFIDRNFLIIEEKEMMAEEETTEEELPEESYVLPEKIQ